jgi:hypothetical protein
MLTGLRHWLATIVPKSSRKTTWRNYSIENTYAPPERELKLKLVEDFCKDVSPASCWISGATLASTTWRRCARVPSP